MHGSAAPTASIGMAIEFEHGDMQVTISDDGNACAAPQTPGRHGGRGMPIINAFTKGDVALTIGAHSTTIEMDFACPSRADHASLVRRRRPVRT
jgi:hypothetical protein